MGSWYRFAAIASLFSIVASGCSGSQIVSLPTLASISEARNANSFLYVANGRGTVTLYAIGTQRRSLTVKTGPAFPRSIAVDASGRLYVPYWGGIKVFGGPHLTLERTIVNGTSAPYALALDSQQNLYVANNSGAPDGSVTVFAPGGSRLLRTITAGIAQPVALAFDKDENLYVANRPLDSTSPTIAVFTTNASRPIKIIQGGVANPTAIAVDAKQTLYVLNAGGNVEVYPANSKYSSATITAGIESPQALAIDEAGKLYVGNARSITIYRPGSTFVDRTLKEPAQTTALAFDADGRLYVATAMSKGTVFVYAPGATKPALKIGASQGVFAPNALAIGR